MNSIVGLRRPHRGDREEDSEHHGGGDGRRSVQVGADLQRSRRTCCCCCEREAQRAHQAELAVTRQTRLPHRSDAQQEPSEDARGPQWTAACCTNTRVLSRFSLSHALHVLLVWNY